jgi:hypothetical protein
MDRLVTCTHAFLSLLQLFQQSEVARHLCSHGEWAQEYTVGVLTMSMRYCAGKKEGEKLRGAPPALKRSLAREACLGLLTLAFSGAGGADQKATTGTKCPFFPDYKTFTFKQRLPQLHQDFISVQASLSVLEAVRNISATLACGNSMMASRYDCCISTIRVDQLDHRL